VALVDLYPSALRIDERGAAICVAVGFVLSYVLGRILTAHHQHLEPSHSLHMETSHAHAERLPLAHHPHHSEPKQDISVLPIIGIALHTFLEGFIYVITFQAGKFSGIAGTVGITMHQVPEVIFAFLLLVSRGYSRLIAAIITFSASGVALLVGTGVAIPLVHWLGHEFLGKMLAACAGVLLYVGAGHLLPHIEKNPLVHTLVSMLTGVASMLLIVFLHHDN